MTQNKRGRFLGNRREDGARQLISQAVGIPFKLMTRFAGSQTARKLGLVEPAQRIIYRGAKKGLRVASQASSRFAKRSSAKPPERMVSPKQPSLFDLTLTQDQQLARDTMRRFARDVMRIQAEEADEACTPPPDFLQQSHELGLSMMAVPNSHGGIGEERSPLSNALMIEDLAWGDMGLAFAAMAPVGVVNALVDWGTADQQATYLPSFAQEQFVPAALALLEPDPLFEPARLRTRAVRDKGDGFTLYGEKSMVPLGETAELFLVAAHVMGLGTRLLIVERNAPGLAINVEPTMGLRSAGLCRLRFDKVVVPEGSMMGAPGLEGFDCDAIIDNARFAWAAMAVGTCQAMLEYVIAYCNERIAFAEPITNRQAVAFMIADMAIELEGMRLLAYRAASRAEQGLSYRREAYLARVQCAEKAMKIGSDGVQLLGGHGYVKDHPVERWYRNLRAIGVMEGGLLV